MSKQHLNVTEKNTILKRAHHEQQELCKTRPTYRQGKRLTTVKVYTVNNESQHLMICGVPKLQLNDEVKRLVSPYGDVKKIRLIPDYPSEEFTDTFHVHYARIQSARIAKRLIDGKNFYGGLLHVFYTPELETISETRGKLIQRRKDVASKIKKHKEDPTNPEIDKFIPKEQYQRKKRTPALPLTEERLVQSYPDKSLTTIYDGIPREIDPRPVSEPSLPPNWINVQNTELKPAPELLLAPYQPSEAIMRVAGVRETKIIPNESCVGKRKNYKGQSVRENIKVRIVRPQIIDTRRPTTECNVSDDKNVFTNVKTVKNGITIKLLPKKDEGKKRIVMKNASTTQLVESSKILQMSVQTAKSQIRETMQKNQT